jgi:hypothetical protein
VILYKEYPGVNVNNFAVPLVLKLQPRRVVRLNNSNIKIFINLELNSFPAQLLFFSSVLFLVSYHLFFRPLFFVFPSLNYILTHTLTWKLGVELEVDLNPNAKIKSKNLMQTQFYVWVAQL